MTAIPCPSIVIPNPPAHFASGVRNLLLSFRFLPLLCAVIPNPPQFGGVRNLLSLTALSSRTSRVFCDCVRDLLFLVLTVIPNPRVFCGVRDLFFLVFSSSLK